MRKLALLVAAGGLWLFVAALPAFADGGPHVAAVNSGGGNGTNIPAGLTADTCAGCHRAHTADAADLLNTAQPDLCLNCHNGSMATTDVLNGVQYTAVGNTNPVLGALRGGGFQFALIDSTNAARVTSANPPNNRNIGHVQPLAKGAQVTSTHGGTGGIYSLGWGTGSVWGNGAVGSGVGATVTLECGSCHNPHGNGQYRILQTSPSLTASAGTYTVSVSGGIQVADTTTTGTHNYTIKPATDGSNQNGSAATVLATDPNTGLPAQGDYWRYHWDPTGNLKWYLTSGGPSADQMNTGWNGLAPVSSAMLSTASSLLNGNITAAATTLTVSSYGNFPTAVPFNVTIDSETLTVSAVGGTGNRTWTVTRGVGSTAAAHNSTAQVLYKPAAPLAFTGTIGATGTTLLVNATVGLPNVSYYIQIDSEIMKVTAADTVAGTLTVTRGQSGTTAAAHTAAPITIVPINTVSGVNGLSLYNTNGSMTAWCVQCHTRYEGLTGSSASSLANDNPTSDSTFAYKHGTTRIGCEQCHVSHGSDALMTGSNSLNYTDPAGAVPPKVQIGVVTSGDSRLLKADNRGTCQLCHDPTQTMTLGQYVGPLPTPGN